MPRGEEGGIVTGWLIKVVVLLLVVAFLIYEAVAIVVTAINLDGTAREVAQVTAEAYEGEQRLDIAQAEAERAAEERDVELVGEVTVDGDNINITITKQAPTLVAHQLGFLKDITKPTASARDRWR